MPLYGHELSETIDPFSAGLAWAVKLDKGDFVGCDGARTIQGATAPRRGSGSCSKGNGSPARARPCIPERRKVGEVTSGTFSPTLQVSLAMAYVDPGVREDRHASSPSTCAGHREPAQSRQAAVLQTSARSGTSDLTFAGHPVQSAIRDRTEHFTRILIHGSQIAWISGFSRVGAH